MRLRRWQREAHTAAIAKFRAGKRHFLCLATPGAGKTLMAAKVAHTLLASKAIDLVFCFAPSVNVVNSFRSCLERELCVRLDGLLGSTGIVLTYQSMLNLPPEFWRLLSAYRVLVIFDEIHHCAGDQQDNANAWGEAIIRHIQDRATLTLALSGTPWRSDGVPISLASYCDNGQVQCDYQYGLFDAVCDGVCRQPVITAIDNGHVLLHSAAGQDVYSSFSDLLSNSSCTYQQLIDNDKLLDYVLRAGNQQLKKHRIGNSKAGGLVVAASVGHADRIAEMLHRMTGEAPRVVTYAENDPQGLISQFRESNQPWIVSVGMISEGTDIPRLQVCCHLTRVKTELYFRQILGRILRSTGSQGEQAHLFMPAEPTLLEHARRVAEDIPHSATLRITSMTPRGDENGEPLRLMSPDRDSELTLTLADEPTTLRPPRPPSPLSHPEPRLPYPDAHHLGLFGRFKREILNLSLPG